MTNIVLYRVTVLIGLLLAVNTAWGQKPAIDLLPSSHQYKHPAAIIDTSFASDTLTYSDTLSYRAPFPIQENLATDSLDLKKGKKQSFKFGLDLDSILHKGEVRKKQVGIRSGRFPLVIKFLNPTQLFIHITALN